MAQKLESFGTYGSEERLAPLFSLPAGSGREVRLWSYKQRQPLVIYFLQGTDQTFLLELNDQYAAYQAENIELLVIVGLDKASVEKITATLQLKYPLLADPDYSVHTRYIKLTFPQYNPAEVAQKPLAVFVADRFGSIFRYATATEIAKLPPQTEILSAHEFISCLCNP